jgi:hypothetical protein
MAVMKRDQKSLSVLVTKALESVGLLNKGSADIATGNVSQESAAEKLAVVPPALNVTRVSGFAALIASVGAAALAIFNVDKSKDSVGVVAAAYGSVGLVVAASLIAAAVILYADIRARMEGPAAATAAVKLMTANNASGATGIRGHWDEAVKRLETVNAALAGARGDRLRYAELWLDASGTTGIVSGSSPDDDLRDEHARLLAAQGRITELLEHLIGDYSEHTADVGEIALLVRKMRETVNNLPSE